MYQYSFGPIGKSIVISSVGCRYSFVAFSVVIIAVIIVNKSAFRPYVLYHIFCFCFCDFSSKSITQLSRIRPLIAFFLLLNSAHVFTCFTMSTTIFSIENPFINKSYIAHHYPFSLFFVPLFVKILHEKRKTFQFGMIVWQSKVIHFKHCINGSSLNVHSIWSTFIS